MSVWQVRKLLKQMPKLRNPILIEGLPGIGNVGKVAVDFVIDELKAKKFCEFFSYTFPHSVFVNEKNLVELPRIEMYYKKFNGKGRKRDLLFLSGDVQPTEEVSSYEFSDKVLDIVGECNGKEVVTIGGIGLPHVPEKPRVHCTGTDTEIIDFYRKGTKASNKLHGIVGPIVGVSGLLIGLAEKRKMRGVCFLAETYGHPLYLGVKGAREVLSVLNKKLSLSLNLDELDSEIKDLEDELMKKTQDLSSVAKKGKIKNIGPFGKDVNYIG